MNAIKEYLTLVLMVLSIITLLFFGYALFGVINDPQEHDKKELNTSDSQEVCFKIKTMSLDNDGIYLEQSGV